MWFIISHYWVAVLLALGLGLVIGFISCGRSALPKGFNRWGSAGLIATLVVGLVVWLAVFPGRLGLWFETLLLTFLTYIVGCFLGTLLKKMDGTSIIGSSFRAYSLESGGSQPRCCACDSKSGG
jgi:hypothetical protein